jgi:hypothetical protein
MEKNSLEFVTAGGTRVMLEESGTELRAQIVNAAGVEMWWLTFTHAAEEPELWVNSPSYSSQMEKARQSSPPQKKG